MGGEATCKAKAKCATCGMEYGDLADHKYSTATCTEKAKCSVCDEETGELLAHSDTNSDNKCDTCGKDMPTTPGGDEPGTDTPGTDEPGTDTPTPDVPNTNTDKPNDATDKPIDATENEKDDSTETEKKNGCGSTLALSSLAIVAVVGSALVIKKKTWSDFLAIFKKI